MKTYSKDLHCKYAMAPVVKVTGNVAFICDRFYTPVLVTESGLNNNNNVNQNSIFWKVNLVLTSMMPTSSFPTHTGYLNLTMHHPQLGLLLLQHTILGSHCYFLFTV